MTMTFSAESADDVRLYNILKMTREAVVFNRPAELLDELDAMAEFASAFSKDDLAENKQHNHAMICGMVGELAAIVGTMVITIATIANHRSDEPNK